MRTTPERYNSTLAELPDGDEARAEPGFGSHIEAFESVLTGQPIRVRCDCVISNDHSYSDWLDLPVDAAVNAEVRTRAALFR